MLRGEPKAAAALCAASVAADRICAPGSVAFSSATTGKGSSRSVSPNERLVARTPPRRGRLRRRRAPSRCRRRGRTRCAVRRPAGGRRRNFYTRRVGVEEHLDARSKAARAAPSGGVTISAPLALGPELSRLRGRRGARGRSSATWRRRGRRRRRRGRAFADASEDEVDGRGDLWRRRPGRRDRLASASTKSITAAGGCWHGRDGVVPPCMQVGRRAARELVGGHGAATVWRAP